MVDDPALHVEVFDEGRAAGYREGKQKVTAAELAAFVDPDTGPAYRAGRQVGRIGAVDEELLNWVRGLGEHH